MNESLDTLRAGFDHAFAGIRQALDAFAPQSAPREIGTITSVSVGIAKVAGLPGMVLIKAGTLDDLSGLVPTLEVYADHAAGFVAPIAGAQRFGQAPG